MKTFAVAAALALMMLAAPAAHAMVVYTDATGPYNYTCEEFVKLKPRERAIALGFVQGFFAALNYNLVHEDKGEPVNLSGRWRELNAFVMRYCADTSAPHWHRRFIGGAAVEALDEMRKHRAPLRE
jgi:hypothetical protein